MDLEDLYYFDDEVVDLLCPWEVQVEVPAS
jgi:hypothetical protein